MSELSQRCIDLINFGGHSDNNNNNNNTNTNGGHGGDNDDNDEQFPRLKFVVVVAAAVSSCNWLTDGTIFRFPSPSCCG